MLIMCKVNIVLLTVIFFSVTNCLADDEVHLNPRSEFGSGFNEMPFKIGVGSVHSDQRCSTFSGTMMLTPKALRFYLLKDIGEGPSPKLTAETFNNSRIIKISDTLCSAEFTISRDELKNKNVNILTPDNTNGIPGLLHEKKSFDEDSTLYSASAYFPNSNFDCGEIVMTMFRNHNGLFFLTNSKINMTIKVSHNKNGNDEDISFIKNNCTTHLNINLK